nr:hypothetical protein [Micromonospora sp. DSM 115978]
MRKIRIWLIALAAGALVLAGPAATASAGSSGGSTAALGQLVLAENADLSGARETQYYVGCEPVVQRSVQLPQVGGFDNRPPTGCRVELVNRSGVVRVLCVGRGTVPASFGPPARVVFRPGQAGMCLFAG